MWLSRDVFDFGRCDEVCGDHAATQISISLSQLHRFKPGRSLGWDIQPDANGQVLFHTGYTGHFIALDYQNQTAMVVLTNRVHPIEHNQIFLERRQTILDSFLEEDHAL